MPVFEITDPATGRTAELEGDSPPTEAELLEIFGSAPQTQTPAQDDDPLTGELGIINNPDGSVSTERSVSVEVDGKIYNMPTLVKGQINPESLASGERPTRKQMDIAFNRFKERGGFQSNAGFSSIEEAEKAAVSRSSAGGSKDKFTDPGTMLNRFLEPATTLVSGAIAEPVAGLFGIIEAAKNGDQAATETINEIRNAITFEPRTKAGQEGLQSVAEFPPVKAFIEGLQGSEQFLGDIGYKIAGPAGGAFGASIPTAILEGLGLVSLKKLRLGKADLIDNAGKPGPELKAALDKAGVTLDELPKEAIADLSGAKVGKIKNLDPAVDAIARKARFNEQGIPFSKGNVTQDFKQIANEQQLKVTSKGEVGEPLRQLELAQSQAFKGNVDKLIDSLGGATDSGEILKGALEGRLKLLKKEKTALYNEFAETSPFIKNLPLVPDKIIEAMPDKKLARRIGRLVEPQAKALDDLLVEFGIDQTPALVEKFIKNGDEITPLTVGNFEDFRQGINQIERADQTGAIKVITGKIKSALDAEAGIIDDALTAAGISDESVLKPLREARATVRTIKTEFSPDSITGKLIKVKKDGVSPVIEASQVVKKVLGDNIPIEHLERTLESLGKAGKSGQKAIKSLQASVVFKALDDALKSPTRKLDGVEIFGSNAFVTSLNKFGDARLDMLFKNDPQTLKKLKALKQTAKDITPPNAAVPKGSASIILDTIQRASRLPIAAAIFDAVKFVVKTGADERAVSKAVKANPQFSKSLKFIKTDYPALANALGIGGTIAVLKEEDKKRAREKGN